MLSKSKAKIYDDNLCQIGEGPIWHPIRKSLIWFDILGGSIFERKPHQEIAKRTDFDFLVSAGGCINETDILMATSESLVRLNLDNGKHTKIIDLEAENSVTRSNDGRADPQGGFWIGTMGKKMEKEAGAIYRFYKGELRKLFSSITVPNSICFSPCGKIVYFTDTFSRKIMRVSLDKLGWPSKEPEIFIDCEEEEVNPDGSVVDIDGCLWNAQWGASRIVKFNPAGELTKIIELDAPQVTCPAFGDLDFSTLFITSAWNGMSAQEIKEYPKSGAVFSIKVEETGQEENIVLFDKI